jgi:hypothetical protein
MITGLSDSYVACPFTTESVHWDADCTPRLADKASCTIPVGIQWVTEMLTHLRDSDFLPAEQRILQRRLLQTVQRHYLCFSAEHCHLRSFRYTSNFFAFPGFNPVIYVVLKSYREFGSCSVQGTAKCKQLLFCYLVAVLYLVCWASAWSLRTSVVFA